MHPARRYIWVAIAVGLAACSSHHSTIREERSGAARLFILTRAEALQIAHNALSESFPGRKITTIEGPPPGYVTTYRIMLDTYSQQVLAVPAIGVDASGHEVRGYYFEVSGSGTAVISGRVKNNDLFERVEGLALRAGRATSVSSWRPDLDTRSSDASEPHPSGTADRLRELESLRKQGLISPREYETKRAQILDAM
jgi:hypothetical protein